MGCKMCQKPTVSYKKGLWSPDEDQKLKDYILKHGHGCWSSVPVNAGLQRNGKSCRLRWINYLRPGLKRSVFTPEEEAVVVKLQSDLGNKWSKIAMHLPGRTDNEVKNHWNTYLKKKVNAKVDDSLTHNSCLESGNGYKKLEQFSDENNSQISLSESLVTSESHSPSSYQSTIHISNRVPELSLPKVLFADWLPVLNGNCHSSSALESTSNSEVLSPELLQSEMIHGLDDSSINGGLQMQIPDASLHDLLFFDEAYTVLELNREMFSNL